MSEYYDNAINWIEKQEIWETLASLELWQYGILVSIPALFFIIRHFKKPLTISQKISKFKKDKKLIEVNDLRVKKSISALSTAIASIGCIHFGFRIGIEAGIAAICISLLFYSFSTSINRKWRFYNMWIDCAVLVLFAIFEISVFTGNYKSQAVAGVNDKFIEERQRIIDKQERLEAQIVVVTPTLSRRERANAQYQNRTLNERIEELEGMIPAIPGRNEAEFFAGVAKVSEQDMDLAELYFYLCLSTLLIMGNTLHNTRINSYYTDESLARYIDLLEKEEALVASAGTSKETSGNKNGSPTDLKTQGSQPKQPKGKKVDEGYIAAKAWVESHDRSEVIGAKALRASMATTTANQATIMNRLKKNHVIVEGTNGNRPEYRRYGAKSKPMATKVSNIFSRKSKA